MTVAKKNGAKQLEKMAPYKNVSGKKIEPHSAR